LNKEKLKKTSIVIILVFFSFFFFEFSLAFIDNVNGKEKIYNQETPLCHENNVEETRHENNVEETRLCHEEKISIPRLHQLLQ